MFFLKKNEKQIKILYSKNKNKKKKKMKIKSYKSVFLKKKNLCHLFPNKTSIRFCSNINEKESNTMIELEKIINTFQKENVS